MVNITVHAVERYRERIENVSEAQARAVLTAAGPAIDAAARFGADTVLLGNGARLTLCGDTVVTVKPKRFDWRPRLGAHPKFNDGEGE